MAIDFFQYQVNRRYYQIYGAFELLYSLALVGLYGGAHFLPSLQHYAGLFGATGAAAILSGITAAYMMIGFPLLGRRSMPLATMIGAMLFTLVLLNGLSLTRGTDFSLV